MLYYNNMALRSVPLMTHHHHPGHLHPSPRLSPSLLRLSVPQRLGLAGILIVLVWAAAFWAMGAQP